MRSCSGLPASLVTMSSNRDIRIASQNALEHDQNLLRARPVLRSGEGVYALDQLSGEKQVGLSGLHVVSPPHTSHPQKKAPRRGAAASVCISDTSDPSTVNSNIARYNDLIVQPFGDLLKALIDRQGLGLREWSRRAGYAHSNVAAVIKGRRPPPLDKIERWAVALDLDGTEKQRFIHAAYLEHAPEQVRGLVAELKARLDAMEEQIHIINDDRRVAEPGAWYPDDDPGTGQ